MMLAIGGRGREDEIIQTLRALHAAGADLNVVHQTMFITRTRGGTALHAATKKAAPKLMTELVKLRRRPRHQGQRRPHRAGLRDVARLAHLPDHAATAAQ